jgi:predicted outer membrane repeat protein
VSANGSVSADGARFEGNVSAGNGGAVWAGGDLDLALSVFLDNDADRGGAVFQNAGGGTVVNGLFARNHAVTGLGEALALQPSGVLALRHSTVAEYPGQAAGSAVWVNGGSVELDNNILVAHAVAIEQAAGAVTADSNLFDGNAADTQGAVTNTSPVAGSPDFVDPASDDYHLAIGSAAVDAGPNVGAVVDIDGELRPEGTGFDLGYDELDLGMPPGCPVSPAPMCGAAASDALQVKVSATAAKDRFTLKHLRAADSLAQADFGDPVAGGNAYQLCIYEGTAGTPVLFGSMLVPGGGSCGGKPCWKAIGSKGYVYKDKAATQGGIRQIVLRAGDPGKGAVLVAGGGASLALPGPNAAGIPYLDMDPGVTIQIHESSTGNCWESSVGSADVQANTEALFKAVRK